MTWTPEEEAEGGDRREIPLAKPEMLM